MSSRIICFWINFPIPLIQLNETKISKIHKGKINFEIEKNVLVELKYVLCTTKFIW